MANYLTKFFSAGASSLVDAKGEAIDKNFTTEEEKKELEAEMAKASMQYELEMASLGIQEKEIYLADTASARENQSRVQESEHASFLAKNVHPLLALGIVGLTFFLFGSIIFGAIPRLTEDNALKDIIIYILGALTTISTQVVAYFFGSSQGSKDKQKSLNSIAERMNKP